MNSQELDTLERMVDVHGLKAVLSALGEICLDKAEHIMRSYDDQPLAKQWARTGASLLTRADKITV